MKYQAGEEISTLDGPNTKHSNTIVTESKWKVIKLSSIKIKAITIILSIMLLNFGVIPAAANTNNYIVTYSETNAAYIKTYVKTGGVYGSILTDGRFIYTILHKVGHFHIIAMQCL